MARQGLPTTQCQLRSKGSAQISWSVDVSGDGNGHYEIEPQEGLGPLHGEFDLLWPSGYQESITVLGEAMHQVGTPAPYWLRRDRPEEPVPDCPHSWISTSGDLGGPATAGCHGCGGKLTGPAAKGAVEAFGVAVSDYDVSPPGHEELIGFTNGPYEFFGKQ